MSPRAIAPSAPDERRQSGSPGVAQLVECEAGFFGESDRTLMRAGTVVRERERQLDHRRLPRRVARRGEREAALAGRDRGLEIVLFGREVAEVGEQLDAQLDRRVLRSADSASSTKRRPSETRSAMPKYQPRPTPSRRDERIGRVAGVGEGSPEVVVLQLEPAFIHSSHSGPRSPVCAASASVAK